MINENEKEPKTPRIKINLYQQTFCSTCDGIIKVGDFVIEATEEKKMCRTCGIKITDNWFSERKGQSHG